MGKECVFGAGFLKRLLLRRDERHAESSMGMVSARMCQPSGRQVPFPGKAADYNDVFTIMLMY